MIPKEKFVNDLAHYLYETILNDRSLAVPHDNDVQNKIWREPYLQQKIIQPLCSRYGEGETIKKFNEVFNAVAEDVKNRYGVIFEDEEEAEKKIDAKPETVVADEVFIGFEPEDEDDEPFKRFKDAGFDPKTGFLSDDPFEGDVDWAGSNLTENVIDDVMGWWSGRGADKEELDLNDGRYDSIDDYICFYTNEVNLAEHSGAKIPLNDRGSVMVSYDQFRSMINTFENPPKVMHDDFCKHFASQFPAEDLEYEFRKAILGIKNELNGTSIELREEEDDEMFVAPASYGSMFP